MDTNNVPGVGGLTQNYEDIKNIEFGKFKTHDNFSYSFEYFVRPINFSDSKGPHTFEFPADPNHFTDLTSLTLEGKIKVKNKPSNGSSIFNTLVSGKNTKCDVSTVNNIIHSQYSVINYRIQDVEMGDSTSYSYPYKAYFENSLSHDRLCKEEQLILHGYVEDTTEQFNDVTDIIADNNNKGYSSRADIYCQDNYVRFRVKLRIDLATVDQYLQPNISLRFHLTRADDSFCLLSNSPALKWGIDLQDLQMSIKKLTPKPNFLTKFYTALKKDPLVYDIDRNIVKFYSRPAGSLDLSVYNLFSSEKLPTLIFVALVKEKALNGTLSENPFYFNHHNTKEIYLDINGVPFPINKYKLDIQAGEYQHMYSRFLENIGVLNKNSSIGINFEEWLHDYFIIGFDLNYDQCYNFHKHEYKSGVINLNWKLSTGLAEGVSIIIYASYRDVFAINFNGEVDNTYSIRT